MKALLRRGGLLGLATLAGLGATAGIAAAGSGGIGTGDSGKSDGAQATFPLRAHHTYGDGIGAGRGHQGQDILARCGKKILAARPGRVRVVDYQGSGAGNYVVVKGRDYDYVYMHMLRKPAVREGAKVRVGQKLGVVGSTGRSSACHLHFEMWSKPGWYRGGGIVNPKPFLKRWDRS